MSFFSKLFKKSKLEEDTRTITNDLPQEPKVHNKWEPIDADYNYMLARHLDNALKDGSMKRYQNIIKFIESNTNQDAPREIFSLDKIKKTEQIKALCKVWVRLKYKCSDKELIQYMTR